MKSILNVPLNETSSEFQQSNFSTSFPKLRFWLRIHVLLDVVRSLAQRAIGEFELEIIESSTRSMIKRRSLEYYASDIDERYIVRRKSILRGQLQETQKTNDHFLCQRFWEKMIYWK